MSPKYTVYTCEGSAVAELYLNSLESKGLALESSHVTTLQQPASEGSQTLVGVPHFTFIVVDQNKPSPSDLAGQFGKVGKSVADNVQARFGKNSSR